MYTGVNTRDSGKVYRVSHGECWNNTRTFKWVK